MSLPRSLTTAVIAAPVAIFGTATLLGFFDALSWRLEVVAFFRLQYAVALAAIAVLGLLLRRSRLGGAAAVLAAANLAVIVPPFGAAEAAPTDATTMRMLVANLDFRNDEHARMTDVVAAADADVLVLTELTPLWARALAPALDRYPHRRTVLQPRAYGIGIYSRLPLELARVERYPRRGGPPSIVADVVVGGQVVTVIATHVHRPLEGAIHAQHLDALARAAARVRGPLAICGDFNTVPWTTPFRRLAHAARLRHLYDRSWPPRTWPTSTHALRIPIDNCLYRDLHVREHRRGPNVGSDHFPLLVDIAVAAGERAHAVRPRAR